MKQNLTDTASTYILGLKELARLNGMKSITIRNSEIQDNLEWESRAPIVSKAMWNNFVEGRDEVIYQPPQSKGTKLEIKYNLD